MLWRETELIFASACHRFLACSRPLLNPGSKTSQGSCPLDHLFAPRLGGRRGRRECPQQPMRLQFGISILQNEEFKKWGKINKTPFGQAEMRRRSSCRPVGHVLHVTLSAHTPGQAGGRAFLPASSAPVHPDPGSRTAG